MPEWITYASPVPYIQALRLMEDRVEAILRGSSSEAVFFMEHPEVYTAGTGFRPEEMLDTKGIEVIYTGRGGKFTYHNLGQRIIYPILNLAAPNRGKDLHQYIRKLEGWIINALKRLGISSYAVSGRVGIWVAHDGAEKKIAAIGIRVKKWVTYHGIAINICNDLSKFSGIIPCGLKDFGVTSVRELGMPISLQDFDVILQEEFDKIF